MGKKVFVVHHSEIFRRGIVAILRNYFNVEYFQLGAVKDLKSYEKDFRNGLIIIFLELADSIDLSIVYKLQKENTVKIIGICKEQIESKNIHGFTSCISLNSSSKDIADIVSEIFNQSEQAINKKNEGDELSMREKDVLQLVALGNTNKEIGVKLFISIHTVISHRKNITEKLGIKSISGLTVYAILNKLIDTDNIDPEQLI